MDPTPKDRPDQFPGRGKVKIINTNPLLLALLTWASHAIISFLPLEGAEEIPGPFVQKWLSPVHKAALLGKNITTSYLTTGTDLPKLGSTNAACPEVKDPPWLLGKFLFILTLQSGEAATTDPEQRALGESRCLCRAKGTLQSRDD